MALTAETVITNSAAERALALSAGQVTSALSITKAMLVGVGLNTSALDFDATFDLAHQVLFDWYITNPGGRVSLDQGGFKESFSLKLPQAVMDIIRPIRGSGVFAEVTREGGV